MTRSSADPNMYYRRNKRKIIVILLYVDDLLLTGDDDASIKEIQQSLTRNFEMTDLGTSKLYLGIEFVYFPSGIYLHQQAYIKKNFQRYNMETCLPSSVPMKRGFALQKISNSSKVDPEQYRLLVGSLIHVTNTRPNINYVVSCISRYMSSHEDLHLQAAKHILFCLKGTIDFALKLSSQSYKKLVIFAVGD